MARSLKYETFYLLMTLWVSGFGLRFVAVRRDEQRRQMFSIRTKSER